MIRPTVRSLPVAALLALAACGADPASDDAGERRVVVRPSGPASPSSATAADGTGVGPSEAAPEIVILPDRTPQRTTRVIREVVVAEPAEAPAPSGSAADLTGAGAAFPAPSREGSEEVTLPAERTQVRAGSAVTLSTDESQVGDPVSATTTEPILVENEVVVPAGSTIHGQVTEVDKGDYPLRRPSMEIVWDRVETPDGRTVPIDARTAGEVGTVVQHPRGDHDRLRNVVLGAGAGGAIGGATGGKRGAIMGAIAGAVMGAGMGHGGVDTCAVLHPGDPLVIIFNRDARVPRGPRFAAR